MSDTLQFELHNQPSLIISRYVSFQFQVLVSYPLISRSPHSVCRPSSATVPFGPCLGRFIHSHPWGQQLKRPSWKVGVFHHFGKRLWKLVTTKRKNVPELLACFIGAKVSVWAASMNHDCFHPLQTTCQWDRYRITETTRGVDYLPPRRVDPADLQQIHLRFILSISCLHRKQGILSYASPCHERWMIASRFHPKSEWLGHWIGGRLSAPTHVAKRE